jgi:hypothetical protein
VSGAGIAAAAFGVWFAGFVATSAALWLTGGEKHVDGARQLFWIWFNTAIWPWTWGVILLSMALPKSPHPPRDPPEVGPPRAPRPDGFERAKILE